jgi:DNA polymerase I
VTTPSPEHIGQPVPPAIDGTLELTNLPGAPALLGVGRDAVRELLPAIVATGTVATDIETFGLGELANHLKCVQLADAPGRNVVVLDARLPWARAAIRWAYAQADEIVLHNSTFDAPALYRNGMITLPDLDKISDTLIYARLAWPGETISKGLEALASRWLGFTDGSIRGLFAVNGWRSTQEGYRRADLDLPQYIVGAALDAVGTARLLRVVREAAMRTLTEDHPFSSRGVTGDEALALREREQRINRIFLRKACLGIKVDFDFYTAYLDREETRQIERVRVLQGAGVRPGVGTDLVAAAEQVAVHSEPLRRAVAAWPRTKTGKMRATKTDVAKLVATGWPVAAAFTEQKQTAKTLTDYLGKLNALADPHGRIHPVTNLLLAAHGRASMGNPPIQQFPADARGMLIVDAPGDSWTSIDWSQIEPVMAANFAGDIAALEGYEQRGEKFYTGVADRARISYKAAKVVLLAQLYGEGLEKLAADLAVSIDDARDLKAAIFRALPKTQRWLMMVRSIGETYRKVPTLAGRIVDVPMGVYKGRASVATHKAINYTVSGSAYDVLADTVISIDDAGLSDGLIFTMHDECIVDSEIGPDVQRIMARPTERMITIFGRTPVINTDLAVMGERWLAV